MSVYYMGEIQGLPQEAMPQVEAFIGQGIPVNAECCIGFVTLGTRQEEGVRLTVISLLSGSGIKEVFMQCNRNSQKAKNLLAHPTAEIAITNGRGFVVLTCTAEVLDDEKLKAEKWEDWMVKYHPQGCTSPDYVILRFVPQSIRAML